MPNHIPTTIEHQYQLGVLHWAKVTPWLVRAPLTALDWIAIWHLEPHARRHAIATGNVPTMAATERRAA